MATTTPNYGLTKPAATDFYNVDVMNANMDKIDAGCAPAGYGLGERLAEIHTQTEVDAFVFGGAKRYYNTDYTSLVPGMPEGHDFAIVNLGADPYFLQLAISRTGTIVAARHFRAGVYGEWEWVNPPMLLGVEYRTTERWNGKAVYRKALALGALPNTSRGHYRWYIDKNATIIRATMHAEKRASAGATTNGDEQYNGDVFFDLANNSVIACATPWTNGNDWYMDIRSGRDLTYLVNTWGEMAYVKE